MRRVHEALSEGEASMGASPSDALRALRLRKAQEQERAARAEQLSLGASLSALDATEPDAGRARGAGRRPRTGAGTRTRGSRGAGDASSSRLGQHGGRVSRGGAFEGMGEDGGEIENEVEDEDDILGSFTSPGVSFAQSHRARGG